MGQHIVTTDFKLRTPAGNTSLIRRSSPLKVSGDSSGGFEDSDKGFQPDHYG